MALAPDGYEPTTRERLGVFRRLRRNQAQSANIYSLTSAGVAVDTGNESAIAAILRTRENWQSQTYDAFDVNGEVHNAVHAVADLMSRITLHAAEESTEPNGKPTVSTDVTAKSILARLGSTLEVSRLLHDMAMQKLLPGEFNLVGIQPSPDRPNKLHEEWVVLSIEEIKAEGGFATIDHPTGVKINLDSSRGDTWIRIWTPHPRHRNKADSPLRPLLTNVDELVWWDSAASAVAMSRMALAGFLGIPTNLESPAEAGDDPRLSGNQRFVKRVFSNIIRAIREPRSPSAAAPFVFTYPWNEAGKSGLEFTIPERPQDALLELRTDRSLRRIAQGFPLPPEQFFGMGDATFRNAGQITKSKFIEIVEPFVIDLIGDLTRHWYRPILEKSGRDPRKFLIWYDASALFMPPNAEEQSNRGVEYGAINLPAWRRVNNHPESDSPTEAEKEEQLAWMRALRGREGNPSVQEDTESQVPDESDRDFPEPNRDHPPRNSPPRGKGQPVTSSANGNSHNELGRRLASIDADLMARLQVMASEQLRTALIKSGNFVRNRARKNPSLHASIRNTPPEDVVITLGREAVTTLGTDGMLDDTFTDVPRLFSSWCDKAVGAAIETAELPSSIVSSATFQLAYSTDDAATSLVRELKELAAQLVFEQSSPSDAPESTDLLVPASLIRRALAKVGNPTTNGTTNLLLATGRTFTKHLSEAGHFANEHEWIYGVTPRKPYNQHRKLDGQRFRVDDSPHQPGDSVENCLCIAAPIFEES